MPEPVAVRLLVLARPRGAVLIASLPLVGFGFAHWERGSTVSPLVVAPSLALLVSAWLVAHAGSMWLNAHLDRDAGPVLLGRAVAVPPVTPVAGYVAAALAPVIAWALGPVPFACALACAVLSILYSHPRTALKGRPIGGPLVNGLGYGAISPLAGFAAADGIPTWRALVSLVLAVLFLLGTYFAAQVFQGEEDRRRGYRTLVVTHGPGWTLAVAHACLRASVLGMLACALVGVFPRVLLATAPIWMLTERFVARWRLTPSLDRGGGLVLRLAAFALASVVLAYADHFWQLAHDLPAGGCGTAIVPDVLASICA